MPSQSQIHATLLSTITKVGDPERCYKITVTKTRWELEYMYAHAKGDSSPYGKMYDPDFTTHSEPITPDMTMEDLEIAVELAINEIQTKPIYTE